MTIVWCMVPEIWSATGIIFCQSALFFALLPPYGPRKSIFSKKWKKHVKILSFYKHKQQLYDVQIWSAADRILLSFWAVSCSFTPLTTPKMKILKKWKNCLEIWSFYLIHHMRYGSWDTKRDGQNFLSFWTVFYPFTPITKWKIKMLKNWKRHLEISSFYTNVHQIVIICCTIP